MQQFRRLARHAAIFMLAILFTGQWVSSAPPNTLKETTLGTTQNVHQVGNLFLAGQPSEADFKILKQRKITRVITLRTDSEIEWDEAAVARAVGMIYTKIQISGLAAMNDKAFDAVRKQLKIGEKTGTLLHCASANRVGAVWLVYRVLDQGVELEKAVKEAKEVGMRVPIFETKARDYIKKHQNPQRPADASVRPGINKRFLDSNLMVDEWIGRFEIESREVYAARKSVVKTTNVKAGTVIADIGAGTGFFTLLFSAVVGDKGKVYAVDISPRFVEHIEKNAKRDGLTNIKTVQCEENSVALPPASIDVAFTCDTYQLWRPFTKRYALEACSSSLILNESKASQKRLHWGMFEPARKYSARRLRPLDLSCSTNHTSAIRKKIMFCDLRRDRIYLTANFNEVIFAFAVCLNKKQRQR